MVNFLYMVDVQKCQAKISDCFWKKSQKEIPSKLKLKVTALRNVDTLKIKQHNAAFVTFFRYWAWVPQTKLYKT